MAAAGVIMAGLALAVDVEVAGISASRAVECDVPCRFPSAQVGGLVRTLSFPGHPWTLLQSMEGPAYYPSLRVAPESGALSTTSMSSAVPMPYFSWDEYAIQRPAVDYDAAIKSASFIARNCKSRNDRESWVKGLMAHFPVDSLSTCLPTVALRAQSRTNKTAMMAGYLFHLAFENQCEDDYVTEKLWGSLEAGTVPVYYGAPNVRDLVPPKSVIVVQDYANAAALGAHLRMLSANRTAYAEYHAWRSQPLPRWFVDKYNFTHTHSECRVCRWAWAKERNLGWDQARQTPFSAN